MATLKSHLSTLFVSLLFACNACASELSITRITAENASQLIKKGPDGNGGIDDWHMSNGTLCAVVSDVEHEAEFSAKGGVLVDLGFCGRADDHYLFASNLLDGSRNKPVENYAISIEKDAAGLYLLVQGRAPGVELQTRYRMSADNPSQINISKRFVRVDDQQEDFNLLSTLNFNYHSMETFIYSSKQPSASAGFNNRDFVTRGTSALGEAAHNADTIIYLSPPTAEQGIAYGWQLSSATRLSGDSRISLPNFALADEESTAFIILSDDFWIGDGSEIGLLQLPQIAFMSLDQGDSIELEETIYVGKRADVASVTDQLNIDHPLIHGTTEQPNTGIHIDFEDGSPFSFVRSDASGAFALRAAPGKYRVRHVGTADRSNTSEIDVNKLDSQRIGSFSLPETATLLLPQKEAMRLVFKGINGTQDPNFVDYLTGYNVADDEGNHARGRVSQLYLAGIDSDISEVELAPGEYRVIATRGPEYNLQQTTIKAVAGESTQLQLNAPQRAFETPGYVAADLHVHAGNSFDNTFSNSQRVRTFVAEHGEVMVASEHDTMFDFEPLINEMGVADKIRSVVGTELTSLLVSGVNPNTGGHVNFFPVIVRPKEYRKGVQNHENLGLASVLSDMQARNPGVLSQLNHARRNLSLSAENVPKDYQDLIDDGAFLDHMGRAAHPYNPNRPLNTHPNSTLIEVSADSGLRDIDFDAMEIINPGGANHQQRIDAVTKDWISFLLQGERITGTANSDSHNKLEQVALPRNMVAVADDSLHGFEISELVQSLKFGNSYGTTGPMLTLDLSGTQMGELHRGATGELNLRVDSADWIPATELRVYINGVQTQTLELVGNTPIKLPIEFTQDSFITIEVHGPRSETYNTIYPGISPFAFSNPIYIDFDKDGKWQPPGLNSPEQRPLPAIPASAFTALARTHTAPDEVTTTMLQHEKINYLEYRAYDLEATKTFFEQVFNWVFVDYGPDYTAFSNQGVDGGFERGKLHSDSSQGAALTVFYSADLEATQQKVIAAGGTIVKQVFSFPGGRRFHFTEPSNNEFAVWSDK